MGGLLTAALEQRSGRYTITNPRKPAYWLERLFGGQTTATGLTLQDEDYLRVAAMFSGLKMVSEDIGGLPLPVKKPDPKRPKASVDAREHPAWALLNLKPNPEMTPIDFRGALTGHAMLRGIGYAEKELDQGMRTRALWPLNPTKMRMVRNGRDVTIAGAPDGQLAYLYTLPDGSQKVFAPDLIFTLPGWGGNGLQGYSVMRLAREAIALSLAAEEHGARFYANDATPGLAMKHPGNPTDNAKKNLRESWEQAHRGLENSHRIAILEEGISVEKIGMDLADAEYVATRKFAVQEVGRFLRIPLTKLLILDDATYSNEEQEDLAYIKGITPWTLRWEQRLALHEVVESPFFAHHTLNALARGDMAARSSYYHSMKLDGNVSANTILSLEDLPLDDSPAADELLIPENMRPASSYDKNGMTYGQRVEAASALVRVGFEPADALKALNLPEIAHSGLVPTSIQIDPTLLPQQGGTK